LTLSGPAAPDFRELQDRAAIVLINCFGNSISRGVRRLLQALVLSDVTQAVFARKNTERPFLWLCDEAQTFFATPQLRENLTDLLTMSRSFGSFFTFFTQNLATAVHDQKMRSILDTNVRWTFSMRGQPADCDFLKSALPVSGKKYQPADDPFQESRRYSLNEERALVHEGIAHLPDREGYLWLRTRSGEALRIRTADCPVPEGEALDAATGVLQADPAVGGRLTRSEYERVIDLREQEWREKTSPAEPEMDLAAQFERRRGRVR
jgi:hypothetical protein